MPWYVFLRQGFRKGLRNAALIDPLFALGVEYCTVLPLVYLRKIGRVLQQSEILLKMKILVSSSSSYFVNTFSEENYHAQ